MKSIKLNMTGETISFVKTGKDTNGEYAEIIVTIPARKNGPPKHIHPMQDEYFEPIQGKLELKAGRKKTTIEPGQTFKVSANTSHTFANRGNGEVIFTAIYKPALDIDYFLVQSFNVLNQVSNPKRPGFQITVDFDYVVKQIPGQFKIAGFPGFVLALFAATGRLFSKPKAQSLEEYSKTLSPNMAFEK